MIFQLYPSYIFVNSHSTKYLFFKKKNQIFFLPSDALCLQFFSSGAVYMRGLLLVCFPHLLQTFSALAMLCQLGPSLYSYRTVHAA